MKIRHNMAYRAPESQNYFGLRASELRAAAESGDAGAAAELQRRAANAADPTTKAGQRSQKRAEMKAQKESAPRTASAVEKAAEEGKLDDRHHAAASGATTEDKPLRHPQSPYKGGKIHVSKQVKSLLTAEANATGRDPKEVIEQYRRGALDENVKGARMVHLFNPRGMKRNGLPYPGAQVLYPRQGITQGGTGPFYGPTGTLFDRTPDLLWEYKANPRMRGVQVLWPKTVSEAGPIQGGSPLYMQYPSGAPFDRMPNFTRTLTNKKRSR